MKPHRLPFPVRPGCDSSRLTPGVTHGKIATYSKGCACDACRSAWRDYRRDRERERRRARKLEEARALLREAGEL